jgi:hypothetical protein
MVGERRENALNGS